MRNLLLLLIASLALSLYSCTVAGFAVGALVDTGLPKQDSTYVGWHEPKTMNYLIQVDLNNGDTYEGRFKGYEEDTIQFKVKKEGMVQFLPESVDQTTVLRQKRNGKWIGMAVGVAIDAIIVMRAMSNFSFSWGPM